MGSEQNRFPQQERERKRWGGCWGGLGCFGTPKGGKRIVPASRIPVPEGNNASSAHQQGAVGLNNNHVSLLAPPSSPASFSNSAVPSTAHSPSSFLSNNNSPAMYVTGPYAHETQLVSPPVFSTFTTEPSTAPLTPPPELAHLTTPSSPDVPFAHFLDHKSAGDNRNYSSNDLRATYSLHPGSPALSRTSSSFPERDMSSHWECSDSPENPWPGSAKMVSQDTNFFCPDTYAQFYLDPHSGGRLSVSKDCDVYNSSSGGGNKGCKQDVEEIEAYRASFGFSADEILNTPHYVEICDGLEEDSFTMRPPITMKNEEGIEAVVVDDKRNLFEDEKCSSDASEEELIMSTTSNARRKMGVSRSDAEIDYRRGSAGEGKGAFEMA